MSRPACCREKDAAQLIRTIVSVVAHCHHLGVIHRRACCCMAPNAEVRCTLAVYRNSLSCWSLGLQGSEKHCGQ